MKNREDKNMEQVMRKPITVASDVGLSIGKWFPFPVDIEKTKPRGIELDNSELLLWCPYCNSWEVFARANVLATNDPHVCTGACKWANTNDFYVKKYNKLWGMKK